MNLLRIQVTIFLVLLMSSCAKQDNTPTLKSILLEQLKNTHTNKDWYVPTKLAVDGLTAEQANVKDSTGNHSIGELVSHLIFWNERILIAFHGDTPPNFNDDNEVTFKKFDGKNWTASVQKLDSIQSQWEHTVENATDNQLNKWSSSIANICSHNAYHTGQIIYIRKQHGWWKSTNGVK